MKTKVCIYARVSTGQQSTGLEAKVRALMEYCRVNNTVGVELFTDENKSGAKASRPALNRMMALIKNNEIDKVICYSLSRLGRSITHLLKLKDLFATPITNPEKQMARATFRVGSSTEYLRDDRDRINGRK